MKWSRFQIGLLVFISLFLFSGFTGEAEPLLTELVTAEAVSSGSPKDEITFQSPYFFSKPAAASQSNSSIRRKPELVQFLLIIHAIQAQAFMANA